MFADVAGTRTVTDLLGIELSSSTAALAAICLLIFSSWLCGNKTAPLLPLRKEFDNSFSGAIGSSKITDGGRLRPNLASSDSFNSFFFITATAKAAPAKAAPAAVSTSLCVSEPDDDAMLLSSLISFATCSFATSLALSNRRDQVYSSLF